MINELPVVRLAAIINNGSVRTPKAKSVFEAAARLCAAKYSMCDMGIANGTLNTLKASEAFMNATQIEAGMEHIDKEHVRELYRTIDWKKVNKDFPVWAVGSARAFLGACVKTCAGIDIIG